MGEPEKQEESIEPSVTEPEVWGPTKPPRILLIGRRYDAARGVRYRTDKRRTPIGQRVTKFERRYWRRGFARRYRVRPMGFGISFEEKVVQVDVKLENERQFKALSRENSENSHEAKRLYEKDRAWRSEQRKKAVREDYVKRTGAGESLKPLGVQPSRKERRDQAMQFRKDYKRYLKQQALADRMLGAIGLPRDPSTPSSANETEPSPPNV